MNLNKCQFFRKEVRYLGHVVSAEGVATDPDKILTIVNWNTPTLRGAVIYGLGLILPSRCAVFSQFATPLHRLTTLSTTMRKTMHTSPEQRKIRDSRTFADKWDEEAEHAF